MEYILLFARFAIPFDVVLPLFHGVNGEDGSAAGFCRRNAACLSMLKGGTRMYERNSSLREAFEVLPPRLIEDGVEKAAGQEDEVTVQEESPREGIFVFTRTWKNLADRERKIQTVFEIRTLYPVEHYVIPCVLYNGNPWGKGLEPKGLAYEGKPWVFSYDRESIPSCTLAENGDVYTALFASPKDPVSLVSACSLEREESGAMRQRIFHPVKEEPLTYCARDKYAPPSESYITLAPGESFTVTVYAAVGKPEWNNFGMAALLPHTRMEMTPEYQVLVDDMPCENLAQRQAVLQKRVPQSGCIQFDDLKAMKKDDLRAVFTGKQVVYIYHNQIDARGDKPNAEDEVFAACREAVEEIAAMIRRIAGSANTLHFIVTADHGFLYKRHALAESDKIPNTAPKTAFVNRRFIVDADPIAQPGVASLPMATVLNTKTNTLTVSYPTAANVFKVAGGGENYVHGGSSPQEMIVPVLDVRMEKGRMETTTVQLTLVSILKKITNLITALDFMQNEPISDTVRETTFRVYFVGEDNERISNENIVVADKRGETAAERMFRLRFSFKNQKYDNKKPYYLVAYDDKNSVEVLRRQVVMDIAMADDFGFGF